ncbi:MAG TPA: ribokinase [Clostridiales bacterium]|nr:ribokinase [Clostridiales bacterium]
MYSSIIIGHVTMDENIDHLDNSVYVAGGAVLYSSASAYALGHNVLAITKLAEKDKDRAKEFTLPPERVIVLPSTDSYLMYNKYLTPDKERRICRCDAHGDGFKIEDIPENLEAHIYHLAGLTYGDFDNDLIKGLAKRGKVAVDVQGFLRHRADDHSMYFEDWADKKEMLPYIYYLKTDAAEAEIMTGTSDRKKAAEILYSWGSKEIVITHNTEVLAYDGKDFYTCPIKSRNLSGRTGRGDTTFAAYLNERLNNNIETALLWATATVSLKMETVGVFKGTKADVQAYIDEFYK